MKYFVLLASYGETSHWDDMTPEEQQVSMEQHGAFAQACAERDGVEIVSGEALTDASLATTLRTRGGSFSVTDGPFAEATEQIGGPVETGPHEPMPRKIFLAVLSQDLIDALLARRAQAEEQRPSIGCNIKWKPGSEPDYYGAKP